MKKRGFTLVELLAVIAILAILVIMAIPAVLRMFNQARKDSFTNEINTVIRTSRQKYLLSGGTETTWSNAEGSTSTLDLTGNSHLKYYVEMNSEGKITKLQVTNGDFQYSEANNAGIDMVESGDVQTISDLEENEILVISTDSESPVYVYSIRKTGYNIGDTLTEGDSDLYDNPVAAANANVAPVFLRLRIEDDTLTESYVGIMIDHYMYYLKSYDTSAYAENKNELNELFDESNCIESTVSAVERYSCNNGTYSGTASSDGEVSFTFNSVSYCKIQSGQALCGKSIIIPVTPSLPSHSHAQM